MSEQRKKRLGLALGGGVVRGMAHIGVLSVLEEFGIPIDYVSGTSAGSIVGCLYCSGWKPDLIRTATEHFSWWSFLKPVWPSEGFFCFEPLRKWLERKIGSKNFQDLQIPLCIVAADLENGQPVEFTEGPVAPAVEASCSVPGFIRPVRLDGKILGDGSLTDTVPIDVLRRMGADFVIGVDIFSSSIHPRLGPFGMGFTAIEILVQRAGGGIDNADCLIRPQLAGYSYIRFSKREEYFQLGREAAMAKLPQIRAAIGL